jgi:hypothetical protein
MILIWGIGGKVAAPDLAKFALPEAGFLQFQQLIAPTKRQLP